MKEYLRTCLFLLIAPITCFTNENSFNNTDFINTEARLIIAVDKNASFSAQELAEAVNAFYLEVDERNPFKSFENIYTEKSFVIIQTPLYLEKPWYLGRRFGYRFISMEKETLEEAIKKSKAIRQSIPKYTSQSGILNEDEKTSFYNLLQSLDEVLTENNIKYWASKAMLLGAVSFQEILPWDDELTICIFDKDEHKLIELTEKLQFAGLGLYYDTGKEFYKIYNLNGISIEKNKSSSHPFKYPSIDLFVMNLEKTLEVENFYVHKSPDFYKHYPADRFDFKNLEMITLVPFGPISIPIPSNPETYLDRYYGKPNYPKIWKKYAQEAHWNHKLEQRFQKGAALLTIDYNQN